MVVYTTSILATPLLLTVWAIDIYLAMILLRWLLDGSREVSSALARITDPIPRALSRLLSRWLRQEIHDWIPWVIVTACCVVLRNGLLWLAVAVR